MLLAIDVGNTNITIGLIDKKEIKHEFRLTTDLPRTSDEFGASIMLSYPRLFRTSTTHSAVAYINPSTAMPSLSATAPDQASVSPCRIRLRSAQTGLSMQPEHFSCMAVR